MLRIKLILFWIFLLAVTDLSAQTLKADRLIFQSEGSDNAFWPFDNNGECSTKIIIQCNLDSIDIQSDLINKQLVEDGQLVIYVFPPKKNTKTLKVRHDNYAITEVQLWDEDKPLSRGCVYTLSIEALDITLPVTITSIPEGGTIIIDGKNYGETPKVIPLIPGLYRLEVDKEGYTPLVTTLNVSKDSTLYREYNLSVISPKKINAKLLGTSLPGLFVLIDKKDITESLITIASGKHIIEYTNNGSLFKKDIELYSDATIDFSVLAIGEQYPLISDGIISDTTNVTTEATCVPAKLIETGNGFFDKQDYTQAIPYFQRAADLGSAESQYKLALCLKSKDKDQYLKYLVLAAEQNHPKAQTELGCAYLNGQIVTKDFYLAQKWLMTAALNNDTDALDVIGFAYCKGLFDFDLNRSLGREYLRRSISLGSIQAKYVLALEYLNNDTYGGQYKSGGENMLAKLAKEGYQKAIDACNKYGIDWRNKAEELTPEAVYYISYDVEWGVTEPKYPGGDDALFSVISEILQQRGYTGVFGIKETIHLRFFISKDGEIRDITFHTNFEPTLKEEYENLIKKVLSSLKIKKFIPANRDGRSITCQLDLRIPILL